MTKKEISANPSARARIVFQNIIRPLRGGRGEITLSPNRPPTKRFAAPLGNDGVKDIYNLYDIVGDVFIDILGAPFRFVFFALPRVQWPLVQIKAVEGPSLLLHSPVYGLYG